MSSAFDSEVYSERQRLPGVSINLPKLLRELLWGRGEPKRVTVTLEYRPDVAGSLWWEIRWGDQFAAATELELCLFRAAVIRRRDDERAQRYARIESPPTSAPSPPPPAQVRDP